MDPIQDLSEPSYLAYSSKEEQRSARKHGGHKASHGKYRKVKTNSTSVTGSRPTPGKKATSTLTMREYWLMALERVYNKADTNDVLQYKAVDRRVVTDGHLCRKTHAPFLVSYDEERSGGSSRRLNAGQAARYHHEKKKTAEKKDASKVKVPRSIQLPAISPHLFLSNYLYAQNVTNKPVTGGREGGGGGGVGETKYGVIINLCEFVLAKPKSRPPSLPLLPPPTHSFPTATPTPPYHNAKKLARVAALQQRQTTKIHNLTLQDVRHHKHNYRSQYPVFRNVMTEAVQLIREAEREGKNVLVNCLMGVNRSSAVVVAFALLERGWQLKEAVSYVEERKKLNYPAVNWSTLTNITFLHNLQQMKRSAILSNVTLPPSPPPASSSLSSSLSASASSFPSTTPSLISSPFLHFSSAPPSLCGDEAWELQSSYSFPSSPSPSSSPSSSPTFSSSFCFVDGDGDLDSSLPVAATGGFVACRMTDEDENDDDEEEEEEKEEAAAADVANFEWEIL